MSGDVRVLSNRYPFSRTEDYFPLDISRGMEVIRLWPNFQKRVSKHALWCDKDWLAWLDECEVRAVDYFQRRVPQKHIPKWSDAPSLEKVDQTIIDRFSMSEKYIKQRQYRERHKKAGLCIACPRPTEPGRVYCKIHAKAVGNGSSMRLWKRMDELAKQMTSVTELRFITLSELSNVLGCSRETARHWKINHMKKLLEDNQ